MPGTDPALQGVESASYFRLVVGGHVHARQLPASTSLAKRGTGDGGHGLVVVPDKGHSCPGLTGTTWVCVFMSK